MYRSRSEDMEAGQEDLDRKMGVYKPLRAGLRQHRSSRGRGRAGRVLRVSRLGVRPEAVLKKLEWNPPYIF